MKIHKKNIKKPKEFPYIEYKAYKIGKKPKFRACIYEDGFGALFELNNYGELVYVRENGDIFDWLESVDKKIKKLQNAKVFLEKVKKDFLNEEKKERKSN